jgi:hypothetical protein
MKTEMKYLSLAAWLLIAINASGAITVTDQAGKSVTGEVLRVVADSVVFQVGAQRTTARRWRSRRA